MKKIHVLLSFAITGIALIVLNSCSSENITKPNTLIKEPQESFNKEGLTFGAIECPYSERELLSIVENKQKAAWPKIKVTATFGGFVNSGNNPCNGCENCGCCVGLCIEIIRGKMAYIPLTDEEVARNVVLFDFVDLPSIKQLVLIPKNNIDNGDGWLHVDGDNSFSQEISDHFGRQMTLKKGSYRIVYTPQYEHGIVVVHTV
jgi:hypothetical protein